MAKKIKKIFKQRLKLAPKVSINRKWTIWRKAEMKNRTIAKLQELKQITLHSLFKNTNINSDIKLNNSYKTQLAHKISDLSIRGASSKQKNYCYYIGRSRSFNRSMYMARHTFRKFARFGMLPGFIKERC